MRPQTPPRTGRGSTGPSRTGLRVFQLPSLRDQQADKQQARAAAEDSRQATAKAEAKEREFQTKIDRSREELRAMSLD
jgi:hypothetical protein